MRTGYAQVQDGDLEAAAQQLEFLTVMQVYVACHGRRVAWVVCGTERAH